MNPPPRRPLTLELLADLHAGVLDEHLAAELWAQVRHDPRARSMLAALDATVADLSNAPPLRMPADRATRLDTALAGELARRSAAPRSAAPRDAAGPVDLGARRRRRRALMGSGAVAAAAAAVVGVVVLTGGNSGDDGPPLAGPGEPLQLTVRTVADGFAAARSAEDYGPLADPALRADCLRANGVDPAATGDAPIGARQVVVDGEPGVLLVLPTGEPGRFRLLVVGTACGPGEPASIADRTVGP